VTQPRTVEKDSFRVTVVADRAGTEYNATLSVAGGPHDRPLLSAWGPSDVEALRALWRLLSQASGAVTEAGRLARRLHDA
jgi:hypothetical protein